MNGYMKLLLPALAVAALAACGGQPASVKPASPSNPLTVARGLYCADLKLLQSDLARAGADQAKYAAAELSDAGRLSNDATSFQAAGDSSDAVKIQRLSIALSLDGQARQQANLDPQVTDKIETDTVTAVKDAPGCSVNG